MKLVGTLNERFTERARSFVRRETRRPEVLPSAGSLLQFPDDCSYLPPDLLAFGSEPGVTEHPWVTVGRFSSINGGTRVLVGGGHHPEWVSTFPFRIFFDLPGKYSDGQPSSRGPVHIGNDVWIGYDVVIQSGVCIGDGAIVATGSLVHKDVAPFSVVGGNPQQFIRWRFDEASREALLRIRWWEWPREKVLANVDQLNAPDLASFIAEHDRV